MAGSLDDSGNINPYSKIFIMKRVMLNHKKIDLYESIDEMPIQNFQKYNKFLLLDAGIGSDTDDVDSHIVKIAKLIGTGDKKKALQELQNMRQNLWMVNNEISPKYMAFAALIARVDGKEVTDLSDEGLKALLDDIKKARHSSIIRLLLWLKKKVQTELETYFPQTFTSTREKEAYDMLKRRTMLVLDSVANGNENEEKIAEIDDFMFKSYKPSNFSGPNSVEVSYDKQYASMCLLIGQRGHIDAQKMTALQFYSMVELIRTQIDAELKSYKSIKR